jgi:pilus assembly protein CpaF
MAGQHDPAAVIEAEVRELVRRRGLDPVTDPAAVAHLVDEVLVDYLDRSAASSLPDDPKAISRAVFDAVAGFGPLQPLLDDHEVDDYRAAGP